MIYSEIMDVLSRQFSIQHIASISKLDIKDVRLLDKKVKTYSPDILYVGYYSQLVREQLSSTQIPLLLCGQVPKDFLASHECLSITSEEDFFPIYNSAKDLCLDELLLTADLTKFLAFSRHNNYLTDMVNEAAHVMGNPIIVMDISYDILAYSDNSPSNDPWWTEFSKRKHFSYEFIRNALHIEQDIDTGDNEPFLVTTCSINETQKLSSRMVANHKHVGSIVMRACNIPVTDKHFKQLAVISKIIAETVESRSGFKYIGTLQEKLFADILDAENNNDIYDACLKMENICGKDIPEKMCALVIQHRDDNQKKRNVITYLRFGLKSLFSSCYVTYHKDHLVMITAIEGNRISLSQEQIEILVKYAESENIIVGISNCFSSISQLKNAFRQGLKVLDYAQGNSKIHYYSNNMFEDMLAACVSLGFITNIYHPILDILKEYDLHNGSELFETLRIYLESNKNINQCAEQLCLHRSSLYYRLNRIKELTETNIDEPNLSFILQCSYRILKGLSNGIYESLYSQAF